jgi:hypothetical protein
LARFPDVSHDVRVSDASNGGRAKIPNSETGVLANLPRTRPQRSSPRRAAARATASSPANVKPEKAETATAKPAKAKRTNAKPANVKPAKTKPAKTKTTQAKPAAGRTGREETVPRQGFEVDGDIARGSVQPPGAAELVSSAAELAGELAKAGVTGGARLFKDLFTRLPRS